jgi:hypothetical protein
MSKSEKQETSIVVNPLAQPISLPIYCLSITRYPDRKTYFYAYYNDMHVLLCSAFRISWHLLAKYPIEYFKGDYFAIRTFYKLEKVEQYMINALLYIRYAQDFTTALLGGLDPQPEERIYKPIPSHFFGFPEKHLWAVVYYFNMLVINSEDGYEVAYQHRSTLKTYFKNTESPLPIEKIDELLDESIH